MEEAMKQAIPMGRVYVLDRIEGAGAARVAVLVPDAGESVDVPASALPKGMAVEGAVLRVPVRGGEPAWGEAVRDAAEQARRKAAARARVERMRGRDPGGDVVL
jgi:hypothetical protein